MIILRLIAESFRFAWNALRSNLLRTMLSLLGVTIGIFAIIAAFTVVDSLESSVNKSLSFLGRQNMNIQRFPLAFGANVPWWEYFKRPYTNYKEYEYISRKIRNAEGITIFAQKRITPKYKSNSVPNITCLGIVYGHKDVYDFKDIDGRYFTEQEIRSGQNVVLIGTKVKEGLFSNSNAIGKEIKIQGLGYRVIGILEEEGEGLFGAVGNDYNVYIPFKSFTKNNYVGKNGIEPQFTVKGFKDDVGLVKLEYELKGYLRKLRGLKPNQKDNFELLRQEAIIKTLGGFFDFFSIAGIVIGGFSILVGGFGIANIMFVSVTERTSIIGLQKSLGAKNFFILFQFLFESIFLSVVGGGIGILIVFGLSFLSLGSMELTLTLNNVIIGLSVSTVIGILFGIIPAIKASKMDPVKAIRS